MMLPIHCKPMLLSTYTRSRIADDHSGKQGRTTDPSSSRVRELISKHYDEFDVLNDREHFGDAVLYIRRAGA
jgi:hypothetical protein